jgi:site-specific recombinase XerD
MENDFKSFENYMRERELSENTISAYINDLKTYIKESGNDFSKDRIVDFKWKMLKIHKARTVNHYITAIKAYLKFKGESCDVKKVKVQKMNAVENVITKEQYDLLIANLKSEGKEKYAMYFQMPAKTGARVSEFLKFTKRDLDRGYAEFFTKGKVRTIYFPEKLRKEAEPMFKDLKDEDVLVTNRKGEAMTARGFDTLFKNYAKKYGIPKEVAHAHSLRHFFAKEFLKRNYDITLLADLLGHSGVNTTMIYTRNSKEEQISKLNKAVDW